MRSVLLVLIRAYQLAIRPVLGPSCRFYPSCSCYAHQAITKYGARRGFVMTISRLSRCHPWNPGGYDPVVGEAMNQCNPSSSQTVPLDSETNTRKSLLHG